MRCLDVEEQIRPEELLPLFCANLDHGVIRAQSYIWDIFLGLHDNEFECNNGCLSPLIAVNTDGYRNIRSNQEEGQGSQISTRVRLQRLLLPMPLASRSSAMWPIDTCQQRLSGMVSFTCASKGSMRVRRNVRGSTPRTYSSLSRWAFSTAKSSASSINRDLPT